MFYEFKLSHNTVGAKKNICAGKCEDVVDLVVKEVLLRLQESEQSGKVR